ncbi:MAG: hypothetical protein RIC19_21045 [Phaeodactylibacter sp.]|uniref:hypothetical protein n=1 Tax=Phaeodactylibacter sp. TaxID=1940289 RepID=UPI0032EEE310
MSVKMIKYNINLEVDIDEYIEQVKINKGFYKTTDKSAARGFSFFMMVIKRELENCKESINNHQYFKYHFKPNGKEVIFEKAVNKLSEDEVVKIDIQKRVKKTYFTDENGDKMIREESMNSEQSELIEYEYKRVETDTRIIQGYECHRIELKEVSKKEGEDKEERFYTLYVTKEINLPAHLILELATPIIDECPLYVEMTDLWNDKQMTIMEAEEISRIVSESVLKEVNQNWEIEESTLKSGQKELKRTSIRELACS